jgi:hypothetical protein
MSKLEATEPANAFANYIEVQFGSTNTARSLANIHLGDSISSVKLDLSSNEITFRVDETPKFTMIDWLLHITEEDLLYMLISDNEGRMACVLQLSDLKLIEHHMSLHKKSYESESDSKMDYVVKLKFYKIERLKNTEEHFNRGKTKEINARRKTSTHGGAETAQ